VQWRRLSDSVKAIDVPLDQTPRAPARSPTGSHNEAAATMEMTRRRGYRQVGRRPPAFSLTPLLSQSVTLGHAPPPTPSWPRSSLRQDSLLCLSRSPTWTLSEVYVQFRAPSSDLTDLTGLVAGLPLLSGNAWFRGTCLLPARPALHGCPPKYSDRPAKSQRREVVHPLTCTVAVADNPQQVRNGRWRPAWPNHSPWLHHARRDDGADSASALEMHRNATPGNAASTPRSSADIPGTDMHVVPADEQPW